MDRISSNASIKAEKIFKYSFAVAFVIFSETSSTNLSGLRIIAMTRYKYYFLF